MTDWKLPLGGRCRCEQVRFHITQPPLLTLACHCLGCQRMTASAYSLSVGCVAQSFELTAGEPVIGGIHGPSQHFHCPHCKSWIFTRPAGITDLVMVRATMLDEPAWFIPWVETQTAEGFAWAKTGARHSFPRFPEMSAWPALIDEFAKSGPDP